MTDSTIIYTHTDEAPALATYSLLPVVAGLRRPGRGRGGDPGHLAGRPDPGRASPSGCAEDQRVDDALAELGR